MYSNSLLGALNSRKRIRAAAEGVQTTSENLSLSLQEFPRSGGIGMATKVGTSSLSLEHQHLVLLASPTL